MTLAVEFIKREEGLRLKAYRDGEGYSIGYGHNGLDVHAGMTITQEQADAYLRVDMAWALDTVKRAVRVKLTPSQRAALVSLTYNIGSGGFKKSSVLRLLNAGNPEGAADAFLMWIKETRNGVKRRNEVLVARRERERALFLSDTPPPPAETTGAADGQISGGEAKPLIKSKTAWIGFGGVLTSILTVWSQLRLNAPEVFEFVGIWGPALLGAIFLIVMLNRYLDSRRGVH